MTKQLLEDSKLFGNNAAFIEMLYERYLEDPSAVPDQWHQYFDSLQPTETISARDIPHTPIVESLVRSATLHTPPSSETPSKQVTEQPSNIETQERKQVAVLQLINAYRFL